MSKSNAIVVAVDCGEIFTRSLYHYRVDGNLPPIGGRVLVPFGSKDTPTVGLVIDNEILENNYQLKPILEVIDEVPLLSKYLLELLTWTSHYYLSSFFQGVRFSVPHPLYGKGQETIQLLADKQVLRKELEILRRRNSTLKSDILEYLLDHPETTIDALRKKFKGEVKKAVRDFSQRGWVQISPLRYLKRREAFRKSWIYFQASENNPKTFKPIPNAVWKLKKEGLEEMLRWGKILKKEVFVGKKLLPQAKASFTIIEGDPKLRQKKILEEVKKVLRSRGQVLIISPRLYHSYFWTDYLQKSTGVKTLRWSEQRNLKVRMRDWEKIREGFARIVVGGPRSLYLPFKKLSLVVFDEPDLGSLKTLSSPNIEGLSVAKFLQEKELSSILISTSFLSPSLLDLVEKGLFELMKVGEKIVSPFIFHEVRQEELLPEELFERVREVLGSRGKVLYLLNRRGYYTSSICIRCGYTLKCTNCNLNFVYHLKTGMLHCHSCGLTSPLPTRCPDCNHPEFTMIGVGTQRISELLKDVFKAEVFRIDKDILEEMGREKILRKLKEPTPMIIVATEIIFSFWYDFEPDLGIFGNPDLNLRLPDYRGEEKVLKTANLLLRWSGKPIYLLIRMLSTLNTTFWQEGGVKEILDRYVSYGYPPAKRLIAFYHFGSNLNMVKNEGFRLKELLDREFLNEINSYVISFKSKGRYVGVVLLKIDYDMELFNKIFEFSKQLSNEIKLTTDPEGMVFS